MFIPSGTAVHKSGTEAGSGYNLLFRAGLVRQSASGIFTLLPLGKLAIGKLERLIDLYMTRGLSSSRLSLPVLGTRELWEKSGRWASQAGEMYRMKDRKGADFCLSPTHEEAVTRCVAADVNSFRALPVRVHQQTVKFRDELRPRGGLLRGREFIMKDLYTFDADIPSAHETYKHVTDVYRRLFNRLGMSYEVAVADSGAIGGDLNHEFHVASALGEDTLLKCDGGCGYTANQELAGVDADRLVAETAMSGWQVVRFAHPVERDTRFYEARIPVGRSLDLRRLAKLADSQLDKPLIQLHDAFSVPYGATATPISDALECLVAQAGDPCPSCATQTDHGDGSAGGRLVEMTTIECGHTFHLGQKYTRPLNFVFTDGGNGTVVPEMGCHGIGVTRLLQVIAETLRDDAGLTWPLGLEPLPIVVVPARQEHLDAALAVAQRLARRTLAQRAHAEADETTNSESDNWSFEKWHDYGDIDVDGTAAVVDDRFGKTWGWRIKEAELVGAREVYLVGAHHASDGSTADLVTTRGKKGFTTVEIA
ncbi:hypothetical protein PYCC9005_004626 [Savitreella phatthalungensis]